MPTKSGKLTADEARKEVDKLKLKLAAAKVDLAKARDDHGEAESRVKKQRSVALSMARNNKALKKKVASLEAKLKKD
jgi:polyhydroxyalkanoate synthesis regulator phasin